MKVDRMDRLVQRILAEEAGRKSVGRALGLEINYVADEDLKRVAILIPCYKTPHAAMLDAAGVMAQKTKEHAHIFYPARVGTCVIHWTRNALLIELLKSGRAFDYVLFCDDDIVPPPDALIKLLADKKDIVAGLCTRRTDPPIPNIRAQEANYDFCDQLGWAPDGDTIKVDAIGTGFMLISKKALDAVGKFYLDCEYEIRQLMNIGFPEAEVRERYKAVSEHRQRAYDKYQNAWWFRFLSHFTRLNAEYGEDISFCLSARMCGFDIWCNTSVKCKHMGDYAYGPDDFLTYQRELREKTPSPIVVV